MQEEEPTGEKNTAENLMPSLIRAGTKYTRTNTEKRRKEEGGRKEEVRTACGALHKPFRQKREKGGGGSKKGKFLLSPKKYFRSNRRLTECLAKGAIYEVPKPDKIVLFHSGVAKNPCHFLPIHDNKSHLAGL